MAEVIVRTRPSWLPIVTGDVPRPTGNLAQMFHEEGKIERGGVFVTPRQVVSPSYLYSVANKKLVMSTSGQYEYGSTKLLPEVKYVYLGTPNELGIISSGFVSPESHILVSTDQLTSPAVPTTLTMQFLEKSTRFNTIFRYEGQIEMPDFQ